MKNKKQEIADIFSMFHDGDIENMIFSENCIELQISILYIAELIDKDFEYFYLKLFDIRFEFIPWGKETPIPDWKEFIEDNEISSAKLNESREIEVSIRTSIESDVSFYPGGDLIINCADYQLFDDKGRPMTCGKLKDLSSYYWNEKFGKR